MCYGLLEDDEELELKFLQATVAGLRIKSAIKIKFNELPDDLMR